MKTMGNGKGEAVNAVDATTAVSAPSSMALVRCESITKTLSKRKTKDHYSFEDWLSFLDQVFLTWRWKYRVTPGNEECWRDYYDDGYSAEEAAYEDCSYAV